MVVILMLLTLLQAQVCPIGTFPLAEYDTEDTEAFIDCSSSHFQHVCTEDVVRDSDGQAEWLVWRVKHRGVIATDVVMRAEDGTVITDHLSPFAHFDSDIHETGGIDISNVTWCGKQGATVMLPVLFR